MKLFKLTAIVLLMLLTFGCAEIDRQQAALDKYEKEKERLKNKTERMAFTFQHEEAFGNREFYGLLDKQTGREYLIVMTGHDDGGVAIIELKPREEERKY